MAIARTVIQRRDITLSNNSSTTSTMVMIATVAHQGRARTATAAGIICGEGWARVEGRRRSEVHKDGSPRVYRTFVRRSGVMRGIAEGNNLAGTASEVI